MFDSSSRFLIVDDSDISRKTIKSALIQLGLKKADEATDGATALQKLEMAEAAGVQYSLVFCDINMPKMNGFELLETCRSSSKLASIPFLMVTSETQKDIVVRAVMQGVSGYIVKPFGVEDLKKKIRETFEKVNQLNATSY